MYDPMLDRSPGMIVHGNAARPAYIREKQVPVVETRCRHVCHSQSWQKRIHGVAELV